MHTWQHWHKNKCQDTQLHCVEVDECFQMADTENNNSISSGSCPENLGYTKQHKFSILKRQVFTVLQIDYILKSGTQRQTLDSFLCVSIHFKG